MDRFEDFHNFLCPSIYRVDVPENEEKMLRKIRRIEFSQNSVLFFSSQTSLELNENYLNNTKIRNIEAK